jgi:hypothetical protein
VRDPEPSWLPVAAATGLGALPGTQPREAAAFVLDALPDLPHLPELPQRGPWASSTGRTLALLEGLSGETIVSGWRLISRPGRDARHAAALLAEDLDALEDRAEGFSGLVKVQVTGPVTLSTEVELTSGHAAATDDGARRDLAESLAEGLAAHVADLRRRLPSAQLLVQLDESALPICLAGELPTASGLARVRAVPAAEARRSLAASVSAVHDAGARTVVHCGHAAAPVQLLVDAGAAAVSLDLSSLLGASSTAAIASSVDDAMGAALEAGVALFAAVVPTTSPVSAQRSSVDLVRTATSRWGLPLDRISHRVVVTPVSGLAASTPGDAAAAYRVAAAVAASLRDDPEGRS